MKKIASAIMALGIVWTFVSCNESSNSISSSNNENNSSNTVSSNNQTNESKNAIVVYYSLNFYPHIHTEFHE